MNQIILAAIVPTKNEGLSLPACPESLNGLATESYVDQRPNRSNAYIMAAASYRALPAAKCMPSSGGGTNAPRSSWPKQVAPARNALAALEWVDRATLKQPNAIIQLMRRPKSDASGI